MIGRALAAAFAGLEPAEELGYVLLIDELAVDRSRLGADHERRPVRTREQRRRGGPRHELHPRLERPMENHVLLVVDNPLPGLVACHRARRGGDCVPDGNDRKHRRCDAASDAVGEGVVGRLRVGAERLGRDL